MSNKNKLYYDLLEIIEKQDGIIVKQNSTIVRLVNENMEQKNMVNVLMGKEEYLF